MRPLAIYEAVARAGFAIAGIVLMLLAAALVVLSVVEALGAFYEPGTDTGRVLLQGVGFTIIAIAVFDVGKYLIEEEVIRAREMRLAAEARRSMTKFITTIAIAVFLESLVTVFEASKTDITNMIYPTFLLLAGVALVIGLGIYLRLSVGAEAGMMRNAVEVDETEPSKTEQ
jgi:hypothetical protein